MFKLTDGKNVHWCNEKSKNSERHISLCDTNGLNPNLKLVSDFKEVTCNKCKAIK